MDTNETSPEFETINFGKEIAKSFVLSTVVTAGMMTGFLAVGYAITKVNELKTARATKKSAK